MELKLYDTLTREKRPFTPIDPARVRMYVCGPTVYDFAHIGNARPVIVFDVLFRLLRHIYGEAHVTYVRNITDVDDKINARAAERGIPIRELTDETYKNFKADVEALGCLPPTLEPRATEHIEEMKTLIERLVKSGNAYVAEDNVLFDVPSMPDYGRLSKRPLDEMIAGSRVEVAPYKKDPTDFVLWKPSKPGEPGWPSPAGIKGLGRPGWHIECSAMAWKHLGEIFDIHGGGIDLVFPHHENEIAQSRCAFHTGVMANYWVHNGFLQVEGEKMSKSAGNFFTIHELLRTDKFGGRSWQGEVLRLAMLSTHYTQPIDWTAQLATEAQLTLENWKKLVANVDFRRMPSTPDEKILASLADDLNTPLVLKRLHEMAKESQKGPSFSANLYWSLVFLGLLPDVRALAEKISNKIRVEFDIDLTTLPRLKARVYAPKIEFEALRGLPLSANTTGTISTISYLLTGSLSNSTLIGEWSKYNQFYISPREMLHVENNIGIKKLNHLIEARLKARSEKNFSESDRIRDVLLNLGILLKDTQGQSTWEIAANARIEESKDLRRLTVSFVQLPFIRLIWAGIESLGSLMRYLIGTTR